jgi:hypothetical protein
VPAGIGAYCCSMIEPWPGYKTSQNPRPLPPHPPGRPRRRDRLRGTYNRGRVRSGCGRRVPPRLIQAYGDDESSESGLYDSPCCAQHIRGFAWVDSCSDSGELLIGVQKLPPTALHRGLMVLRHHGGSEVCACVRRLPRSIYSLFV